MPTWDETRTFPLSAGASSTTYSNLSSSGLAPGTVETVSLFDPTQSQTFTEALPRTSATGTLQGTLTPALTTALHSVTFALVPAWDVAGTLTCDGSGGPVFNWFFGNPPTFSLFFFVPATRLGNPVTHFVMYLRLTNTDTTSASYSVDLHLTLALPGGYSFGIVIG